MRNLWEVAVRGGVLKKAVRDFLGMLVFTTALVIVLRPGTASVPQADDIAYDVSFVFLLSFGIPLVRGVIELVAVLSSGLLKGGGTK